MWNPYLLCGSILAANMQAEPYDAVNLIGLLLTHAQALTFAASMAFFLAGFFTFAFARALGCSEHASLIAAALYKLTPLEQTFGVPVIDGYGMTEAAPIIASNPLPPRTRKPGSVGVAAGPEVTILDERGNPLGPNQVGEIAVRGANVMKGYDHDAEATEAAFIDGWFRTGDIGEVDAEGYLKRVSGPLLDRIDCHVGMPRVRSDELLRAPDPEPSVVVAARIAAARSGARERNGGQPNAALVGRRLRQLAQPDREAARLLERMAEREGYSARATHRALRVARTVADLRGHVTVGADHIGAAIALRERET